MHNQKKDFLKKESVSQNNRKGLNSVKVKKEKSDSIIEKKSVRYSLLSTGESY